MNKIYLVTKIIIDAYNSQIPNQNEHVSSWLIHKLKHSFGVCHEIMDILYGEKDIYNFLTPEERENIELSAILHDLGRLYQHADGRILQNTEFNHGSYAVDLLKTNPNFNNPIILFAIEEHNKFAIDYNNPYYTNLSEHDKKVADITAKLLRDADKLENIKQFTLEGYNSLMKKFEDGPMSDTVKRCILEKSCVRNINITKAVDNLVVGLVWIFDINYETTKKQIIDLGYIEKGIAEAKKHGATEDDLKLLNKYLRF